MTTWTWNGVTYDLNDFLGYGLYDLVTAGTGDTGIPRWVAAHADAIAESGLSVNGAQGYANDALTYRNQASDYSAAASGYATAASNSADAAADVAVNGLTDTTTTSITPTTLTSITVVLVDGTGPWNGADYVSIVSAAAPGTKRSWGPVTAYNAGTKELTYTREYGIGTAFTDGIVSATGARGASGAGTGDLLSTNNLNDVADPATSRGNLGLNYGFVSLLTQVMN